jgi:hypothetical protein
MGLWISIMLFSTCAGLAVCLQRGVRRQRLRGRQRCVELPDSYYSATGVRRLMNLERWGRGASERRDEPDGDGLDCLLASLVAAGTYRALTRELRVLGHCTRPGLVAMPCAHLGRGIPFSLGGEGARDRRNVAQVNAEQRITPLVPHGMDLPTWAVAVVVPQRARSVETHRWRRLVMQ